jgi:hypothetical protein
MAGRIAAVVGFLLLAGMAALILVSGLIMPYWAVGALAVVWVVALAMALKWRSRGGIVLGIGFGLVVAWLAVAWAGEAFLDWTA